MLAHMTMEGEPFKGDFHKFKSKFKLEAAQLGVTNKHILLDMLGRAVSTNLAFKMTTLLEEPKDHKAWLHKVLHKGNTRLGNLGSEEMLHPQDQGLGGQGLWAE